MITQQIIRAQNLRHIYKLINLNPGISRATLAKQAQLSKTTISSLVDELIAGKYIIDCGVTKSRMQGRHPNELCVNKEDNVVAVINWKNSGLALSLISSDSTTLFQDHIPSTGEKFGV